MPHRGNGYRLNSLGAGPLDIRELARRVDRDVKGVHRDAQVLVLCGLMDKSADGKLSFPSAVLNVAQKWGQPEAMARESKVSGNRILPEKFQDEGVRDSEEIKIPDKRRIGLRLQGAPRGAYSLYVTLGATRKTEA